MIVPNPDREAIAFPPTGSYSLGQLGNSASGAVGFVEFNAANAPDYTWADNPGTVVLSEAGDGIIAGTLDASIRHNTLGGNTSFEGVFRAEAE